MIAAKHNLYGTVFHRKLCVRIGVLVVGSVVSVGAVFFEFGMQPLVRRVGESQLTNAVAHVNTDLKAISQHAENTLKMGRQWVAQIPALNTDVETFERFFMPALELFPEASSISLRVVASGKGIRLRRFDGGWRSEMLEPTRPDGGTPNAGHTPVVSLSPEMATATGDPRQRAWYVAATTGPETIRWALPETSSHRRLDNAPVEKMDEPGLIASVSFATSEGRQVVLYLRLLLRDLSQLLQRKNFDHTAAVAVLTWDGRLLIPFTASPGTSLEDWRTATHPALSTSSPSDANTFTIDGKDWLSSTRRFTLGEHPLRIVAMAPKSDFSPDWWLLMPWLFATAILLSAAVVTLFRPSKRLLPGARPSRQDPEPFPPHEKHLADSFHEVVEQPPLGDPGAPSTVLRQGALGVSLNLPASPETASTEAHLRSEAPEPMRYVDSGLPLLILDPDKGRILDCNPAAARIHGLTSREAATGRTMAELSPPTQYDGAASDAALRDLLKIALDRGFCTREWRYRRPDGSEWDGEVYLVSFHDGRRALIQCSIRDVSTRADSLRALRQIALHDALTGLVSRAPFIERLLATLNATYRSGVTDKRIAVFYLDLDRFKEINEAHGHSIGDEVLREVARRFAGTLRDGELLARMGGDEFAILSFVADADAALLVAERMIDSLTRRIEVGKHAFTPGVSIGIALSPGDGDDPETLLRHADIAMYRAKASRRGCLRYTPEMSQGLNENIALARDLKEALRDRPEQFSLRYQPIFDLRSGRLVGAEALMCWTHPVLGPIPSDEFISMAESRGMMDTIGAWVLNRSCRQILIWRGEGRNFTGRLSINVAVQQIEDTGFPEQIDGVIRTAGLEPRLFELELTESGMMRNIEQSIDLFTRLNALGFSLSIDDFGTGYSSLAYLKRLPARKLKIDRSFVLDMVSESNDHAIVATIIAMGRTLGMRVVAEGVETQAQADALLALGCDEVQGYYFGYPETAASFAGKWLPMT